MAEAEVEVEAEALLALMTAPSAAIAPRECPHTKSWPREAWSCSSCTGRGGVSR